MRRVWGFERGFLIAACFMLAFVGAFITWMVRAIFF